MSVLLVALLGVTAPAALHAQPGRLAPIPDSLAWIGLFSDTLVRWLENGNNLDALCPGPRDTEEWHACRARHLEPMAVVVPVHASPARDARRLGEILILAVPNLGLRAYANTSRGAIPFAPDLFDTDWGYGPWFHQTILARQDAWFRIPVPEIGPAWIDAEALLRRASPAREAPHVETVLEGQILVSPRGDIVVLGVENGVLRARPEQEADMWCDVNPPPLKPWTELRIPFAELFDANGHLRLRVKYTRGC